MMFYKVKFSNLRKDKFMNPSISSKTEFYKNCRSSINEYDDGEDFSGFSKLVAEAKKHETERKGTIRSIFCENKEKSVAKNDN